jgi:hypothetical protein
MLRNTLGILLLLMVMMPTPAAAQAAPDCPMTATISSLRECVQHAVQVGHITNGGIAKSLLAELDTAQAALDRGQSSVAIDLLQAFVQEVHALSGRLIDPAHAAHMVEHAQVVIQALGR